MNDVEKLKDLYKQMAKLTYDKCADNCEILGACCSQMYCHMAIKKALKRENLILHASNGQIPLLDEHSRCKAPPHLRPLCTLHICEKFLSDSQFYDAYFSLRDRLGELEYEIYGLENL